MPGNDSREKFISPAGLVLAGAYLGLTVDEVRRLAWKRGLPQSEVEYELYALSRQGNVEVRQGRLTIPDTAHRLTRSVAERAAKSIRLLPADSSL